MGDYSQKTKQKEDPIPSGMEGKVGPFGHSERVPHPNTLIQEGMKSDSSSKSDSDSKQFELPTFNGKFLADVYEASHIYILYVFIILYLVIYVFLAFYLNKNSTENIDLLLKRIFDYTLLFLCIAYLLYYYSKSSEYDKKNPLPRTRLHTLLQRDDQCKCAKRRRHIDQRLHTDTIPHRACTWPIWL